MRYHAGVLSLMAGVITGLVGAGGVGLAAGAEEPPPITITLALDTSGSVGAVQLARARDLALAILGALPERSEVAVLAFDDQSRIVVPRTSQPDQVRRQLAGLHVGGRFTALHDALYDASRYLREAPGTRKAIVLITDGVDENSALNLEDGLRLATDAQIPVFAVGVGPHPQERVLRRIAKLTGGEYVAFPHARGADLAARIVAGPPTTLPPAGETTGSAPPVAAGTRPAALPAAPSDPGGTPGRATTSGPARMLWVAGGLTAAAALAALALSRRQRRAVPECPDCGRELPTGTARCPACAEPTTKVPTRAAAPASPLPPPELSETVLARMNTTEEYLDKTVTLQERPVLAVTRGPGAGQVFELSATSATSIGRSRANDIQVDDVSVSGQHCRVRPEEGRFVVHDLKSTNGTLVNEKKVTRHLLEEGDVIAIGETSLQYRREMKRG